MALEIARRLIGGTWRTVLADESSGGGLPNPITDPVTIAPTDSADPPLTLTPEAVIGGGLVIDASAVTQPSTLLQVKGPGNDPTLGYGTDGSFALTDANGDDYVGVYGTGEINLAQTEGQKVGFFGVAAVTRPVLPAEPTQQDIADALIALGLVSQST